MQTSQEPPQDLAIYLGLQGFDVESMEVVSAPRLGALGRRIKIVHLLRRTGRHACSDCGKTHGEGLFEEFERIRFRDCSIGALELALSPEDVAAIEAAVPAAAIAGTRYDAHPMRTMDSERA